MGISKPVGNNRIAVHSTFHGVLKRGRLLERSWEYKFIKAFLGSRSLRWRLQLHQLSTYLPVILGEQSIQTRM